MEIQVYNVLALVMVLLPAIWSHSLMYSGVEIFMKVENNVDDVSYYSSNVALRGVRQIEEVVELVIIYECLCPHCRDFFNDDLKKIIKKLAINLDIKPYPYGNAETVEVNGHINITCQHGPEECYGNTLHACVLNDVNNVDEATLFNACLMEYSQAGEGSDDKAADVCGKRMGIHVENIKKCAKSDAGLELSKEYGEKSRKYPYEHVPYIVVNGEHYDGHSDKLFEYICKQYHEPPKGCKGFNLN